MALDPSIPYGSQVKFNTPFEVLGQLGQLRALKQQEELHAQQIRTNQSLEESRRQDIAKQARDETAQQEFLKILSTAKDTTDAAEQIRLKTPQFYQPFVKAQTEQEAKAADMRKTQAEAQRINAEVALKGHEYVGPLFRLVKQGNYDPGLFNFALNTWAEHFPDASGVTDQLRQQARGGPDAIKRVVDAYESTQQQNADRERQTAQAELPGKVANSQIAAQVAAGMKNGLTPAQQMDAKESAQRIALERQRLEKTATTRYQSQDVLNDQGKPVPALFDAVTGTYLDPETRQPIKAPKKVPSAQEMMDSRKFQKSAPVLKAVGELSEKINTSQGLLAKMRGGAEKLAAKANYDDDVAEYQSLVSGFTPLVARALGHTGVLTQQDVDSVKELFPKPGDSKSLRDRKVKRLMGIVGELEGTEGVTVTPTAAPSPAGLTYQDYLKSRGGK